MQKSDHEQLPAQPITIYLMFQGAAGMISRMEAIATLSVQIVRDARGRSGCADAHL
jgi:hypothetical protein